MKKVLKIAALVAVVIALGLGGLYAYNKFGSNNEVRDGIRESLKLEFGKVHRTKQLKAQPKVTWEPSALDRNLRFPIDEYGHPILGISSSEPPNVIDAEPGYHWVPVDDEKKAPAKWKGAVKDTGRLWGIIPDVL